MAKPETRSVSQIMTARQDDILTTWMENVAFQRKVDKIWA